MSNAYVGAMMGLEIECVSLSEFDYEVPSEGFAVRVWFKGHDALMSVNNVNTYTYAVDDGSFESDVEDVHDMAVNEFDHQWSKVSEQVRECDEGAATVSLIVCHEGLAFTELQCKTRKLAPARKGA